MCRAEPGQRLAQKRDAEQQCCDAKAAQDQVHPKEILRGGGPKRAVFPREQCEIDALGRQPIAQDQIGCRHDIADGEADQCQAEDTARDLALIHG